MISLTVISELVKVLTLVNANTGVDGEATGLRCCFSQPDV